MHIVILGYVRIQEIRHGNYDKTELLKLRSLQIIGSFSWPV